MPWSVQKSGKCPAAKPYAVIKDSDGSVVACHATKAQAKKQQAALYANEVKMETNSKPPCEDLFRAVYPGVELRASENGDGGPTMVGHFAVFNQWTEINSIFEGNFMERFAPGAFKKTLREQQGEMQVLFQHGHDPQIGDKPLGPINDLREDGTGVHYEVPLLDAPYVREDILPGLEAGLYGASFRFRVVREEINDDPGTSAYNPRGLPERTVKEAQVREFGPVTFPAYQGASAGVRSLTDKFGSGSVRNPDLLHALIAALEERGVVPQQPGHKTEDAPSTDDAETQSHLDHERRGPQTNHLYGLGHQERRPSWAL